jgi:hypothetical protein
MPARVSFAGGDILVIQYRDVVTKLNDPRVTLDRLLSLARDLMAILNKDFGLTPLRQSKTTDGASEI